VASENIKFIEDNFLVIEKAEDKSISRLVPLKLWKNQRHFIENKTSRNIILKGRQMGQSTGVLADNSQILFTVPYQRQTIVTHDSETSEFLFESVQRFYRNLPWNKGKSNDKMAPKHDWKSGTRMRFPIIDSYIYVDSAKSDTIAIGHTLNNAHCSEVARWSQKKGSQLWADITQTVPKGGIITAESTPRGRFGVFYDVYREAKRGLNGFTPFFYPWWWWEQYVDNPEIYMTGEKAEQVAGILKQSPENFLKEEKRFAEFNNISPAQLAWRRLKIGEVKELFFQEYPENDIDCWMSSDMSVIDGTMLRPYYANVKPGREMGDLTIWKDVIGGRGYVIGVDVASGQARDFSVASVLDIKSMEYVARIRGKINTDMFAEQLIELGHRYNNALLAVERAGHGHSVLKVLLSKDYPNIYYHADYDEIQAMNITDAGWKTSGKTKPLMVNGMISAFRAGDLISWSENLLLEASTLFWEGGVDSRVKTVSGGNDDEWDAVSIALQVRESLPVYESGKSSTVISEYASVF